MIKIHRDIFPPNDHYKIGINKGKQKWRVLESKVNSDFKTDPKDFNDGNYEFPTHPSYDLWKTELINIQGKKCCYCEKPIDKGDLEHFRPKKAWKQANGSPINKPGYYWLAYRWRNLLLSCKICNSSANKGNLFPVSGVRARTPKCSLKVEQSNLINPYEEEVNTEISFYKSTPIPKGLKGTASISILDLQNRSDIKQIRDDKWALYNFASIISKRVVSKTLSINDIEEANERMRIARKNKQPFSGMIKENIRKGTF